MSERSRLFVSIEDDWALVKIVGEGTFEIAGTLKKFYQNCLLEGFINFTIDLGECTLMDSTFVGIILGLGLKLKEGGHALRVRNAKEDARKLLNNLGLDRLVIFENS